MHRYAVQSLIAAKDKIIVPLDVPTAETARALIKAIGGTVGFFKVGSQLFTAAGPAIVKEVERGVEVCPQVRAQDELGDVVAHIADAHVRQDAGLWVRAKGGRVIVYIQREIDKSEHRQRLSVF